MDGDYDATFSRAYLLPEVALRQFPHPETGRPLIEVRSPVATSSAEGPGRSGEAASPQKVDDDADNRDADDPDDRKNNDRSP